MLEQKVPERYSPGKEEKPSGHNTKEKPWENRLVVRIDSRKGKNMKRWNEKYHDKHKQFSLYGQFTDPRNLHLAWEKVRANKGCPGIDRVSIDQFEVGLQNNLTELHRLLKEKKYQPQPVERVLIPKPNGTMRPLGIPTVRDRIVQQALKNVLEPIFEETFLPCSHGYRPGKNAHGALKKVSAYLRKGYNWIVDADIEGFFDHVDQKILMDLVCEKIADGSILDLVEMFLGCGIMNNGAFEESPEGTPQGGVISPLLANIYLNHFDRRMGESGHILVRYADDFLIFCKTEQDAHKTLAEAGRVLETELHLSLSKSKTRVANRFRDSYEFLGFTIKGMSRSPKPKSIEKFKTSIRRRTRRKQPKKLTQIITEVNRVVSGWGNYFSISTGRKLFRELDHWIRLRIRWFKAKRCTRKVSYYTLPEETLRELGLISLCSLQY